MENPSLTEVHSQNAGTADPPQQNVNQQVKNISNFGDEFAVDSGKEPLVSENMEANVNRYPPTQMFVGPQVMHIQSGRVVTNQPPLTSHEWTRFPMNGIMCMNCHQFCISDVRESFKSSAYLWGFLLCCFSGIFCAFIPFLRKDMKKSEHFCPFCRSKLGVYSPEMKMETIIILAIALLVGMALTAFAIYWSVTSLSQLYIH